MYANMNFIIEKPYTLSNLQTSNLTKLATSTLLKHIFHIEMCTNLKMKQKIITAIEYCVTRNRIREIIK